MANIDLSHNELCLVSAAISVVAARACLDIPAMLMAVNEAHRIFACMESKQFNSIIDRLEVAHATMAHEGCCGIMEVVVSRSVPANDPARS